MARPSHPPRLDYSNYTWRYILKMSANSEAVDMLWGLPPEMVLLHREYWSG
jgi:hypothetical protein